MWNETGPAAMVFLNQASLDEIPEEETVSLNSFPTALREVLRASSIVRYGDQVIVSEFKNLVRALQSMNSGEVPIQPFPAEVQSLLRPYDIDGNGMLNAQELKKAFSALDLESKGSIRISNYPANMKSILKELDTDGDEVISAHEVIRGVEALLREKQKNRFQTRMLVAMTMFLVLFTGAGCGVMFALIQASKDSSISLDGMMLVKSTTQPVRTASAEMSVEGGVLTTRCTSTCPANFTSSPIQTSAAHEEMALTSQVDDENFKQLKSMTVAQGRAFVHFQVLAVARYLEAASRFGSVVVIYTHMGEITLDGGALAFHESLAGAFSRAGFAIDQAGGRRLIGVVEILGLFNRINRQREQAGAGYPGDAPSRMPLTFVANTSEYQRCNDRDCWLDGRMVDWVTAQPDGSMAMVTRQQMYSLTFDGMPFTKSVVTRDQWPGQAMVVLQNLTHKLTMQTYHGVSYHCSLRNDTSLGLSTMRRRRRAAAEELLQFVGMATVDGVVCRHFRLPNASAGTEIYEHHLERRVYQLRWSNLKVTFDALEAVDGEATNPLTRADLDMEAAMSRCDPQDRLSPPLLVEEELTDRVTADPSWGLQPPRMNVSAHTEVDLADSGNESSNNASNWSLGGGGIRRGLSQVVSEGWDGTVVHMTRREFAAHRERHLRDLAFVNGDCSFRALALSYPPFSALPGILDAGSLFTMEAHIVHRCDTRQSVAVHFVLSGWPDSGSDGADKPAPSTGKRPKLRINNCLSRSGELQVYLPFAGNPRPMGVQGELTIDLSLQTCLSGIVGDALSDALSHLASLGMGMRIGGKGERLRQEPCDSDNDPRLGNFPVIPQFWGAGFVRASVLNIDAEVNVVLDLAVGARCASNQPNGDSALMGVSLYTSYLVTIDFGFWDWTTKHREYLYPRNAKVCSDDSSLFIAESFNGDPKRRYKLVDLRGLSCRK